jgi:hypothetical protein
MATDGKPVGQNSDLNRIVNMAISHFPNYHGLEGHSNNESMESVLETRRLKISVHHSGRSGHAFQFESSRFLLVGNGENTSRGTQGRRWAVNGEAVERAGNVALGWRGYFDCEQGSNEAKYLDRGKRLAFRQ